MNEMDRLHRLAAQENADDDAGSSSNALTCDPASGDCFTAAGRFISRPAVVQYPNDYRLVHGRLAGLRQDVAFNHAWVEEGEMVHDVSNGGHVVATARGYYAAQQVQAVRKYTPAEALREMVASGHWGPWDDPTSRE